MLQQRPIGAEPSQIPIRPYLSSLGRPTGPATPSLSSGAAAVPQTSLGSGRDSSVERTLLPTLHGGFPAASWKLQGPLQLLGLRAASSATAAPSPFPCCKLLPLVGIHGGCGSTQRTVLQVTAVALGETEVPHRVGSGNGSGGGSGNGSGGFGHALIAAVAALSPATAAAVSCEAGVNTPDENDDEAAGLCSVCMEAPLSILLAPCGHLLLCHQCCEDIRSSSNMVRTRGMDAVRHILHACARLAII